MHKFAWQVLATAGLVALSGVTSCGGGDSGGSANSGNQSNATGSGASLNLGGTSSTGGGSATGGTVGAGSTSSASCEPAADDSGCVGAAFEGETIPLDIYVMFDLSCSMSCNVDHSGCCRESNNPDPPAEWRIQPVRRAMKAFLQDPASAGIGVGLGFFGDHSTRENNSPAVCSVAAHTDAAVEIEQLPGAAPKLIAELDAGEPQGGTPTHLAINGACEYVKDWKQKTPGHAVVILLVTDGIPEFSCRANIELATEAARDCLDDGAGFRTYVLGVTANNNNSLEQLHQIAESGGTSRAYLTDTQDVEKSVLEALNAIRADATIPCELKIPDPPVGETLNTSLVNIGICDAAGDAVVTPNVASASACDGKPGWYYDDPNNPQSIQLCDATCETVSVAGARLFYSIGCQTQVDVR